MQVFVPATKCTCKGWYGLDYNNTLDRYEAWHTFWQDNAVSRKTYPISVAQYDKLGGWVERETIAADMAQATHRQMQVSYPDRDNAYATVPGSRSIVVEGGVMLADQITASKKQPRTWDGNCAGCGGRLGWEKMLAGEQGYNQATYTFYHRDRLDRSTISREEQVTAATLVASGTNREARLLEFAERCHALDRQMNTAREKEQEAMLQRKRSATDPSTWPHIIGRTVVVTGRLARYDRKGVLRALTTAGAYNDDTVRSSTDLVVFGDRPGPLKVKAADEHNTPTIREYDFYELLGRSTVRFAKPGADRGDDGESARARLFGEPKMIVMDPPYPVVTAKQENRWVNPGEGWPLVTKTDTARKPLLPRDPPPSPKKVSRLDELLERGRSGRAERD